MKLAIGTAELEEEQRLLQHVAGCDACSTRLREMVAAIHAAPTDQDEDILAQLPSLEPEQQKVRATRLASRRTPRFRLWSIGLAATVALMAAGIWRYSSDPIAAAYRERRPFEFRVDGMPYGAYNPQRGIHHARSIGLSTNASPESTWRRNLLQRDIKSAIADLERAVHSNPNATSLNDLAVAYSVEAESHVEGPGYPRALELLDQAIQVAPGRPAAHWNRALVLLRMDRKVEARDELRRFLTLETDSAWRAEASKRLGDL